MSRETALAFRDAVAKDAAIQKQLAEAKGPEDLVTLGQTHGFDFTLDECKDVLQSIHTGETASSSQEST